MNLNKLNVVAYINTIDGVKITVEVPLDITVGKMEANEDKQLSLPLSAKLNDGWFNFIVDSIGTEAIESVGVVTNGNNSNKGKE